MGGEKCISHMRVAWGHLQSNRNVFSESYRDVRISSFQNSERSTFMKIRLLSFHYLTRTRSQCHSHSLFFCRDLRENGLAGHISPSIARLKSLQALRLSGNRLTGSIPSTIGSLSKLEVLGLYNNTLTGTLPETLGNLTKLKWAGLWSNNISGTIPESFQNMTNLEYLHLDRNNLTSIANATVGNMPALRHLTLQKQRNMTGSVPDSLCSWVSNETRPKCEMSGNNFTCPFACKEMKSVCKAKCVNTEKKPEERKKKKKKDPNDDIRLMGGIMRIAETEGALNKTRFSALLLEKVNADLTEPMLDGLFKAFDFDKSENITHDELIDF